MTHTRKGKNDSRAGAKETEHSDGLGFRSLCEQVLNRNMRLRVLRGVPPLAGLSEEQLEMVSRGLRIASFKKGQKIIRQGKVRFLIAGAGFLARTEY